MAYPPPSGGQPTSFKTNVNRAKTKRWVEAKSYSYDGDDWGDMDEYDEYGGYDEPPPPPRPTGLRQRGQSVNRDQQGMPSSQQPGYANPQASHHGYGNLGIQPPPQQQYGARSATNPPYQQSQLPRSGSFDRGDERRAFSAAIPQHGPPTPNAMYQEPPYAQGPNLATQKYQTGPPIQQSHQNQAGPPSFQLNPHANMQDHDFQLGQDHSIAAGSEQSSYFEQPRRTSMGNRTQSMTSNVSANDFHNRRDFSPSAVPPPLHPRGSPSPHHAADSPSIWRPPRKSSLSQLSHSDRAQERQDQNPAADLDAEEREAASGERAGSDTTKPLPFVRPADIYRRMQEEKERERQSQDSSRPSMDAIMADDPSRNDPRRASTGTSARSQDADSRQALRSSLDPVAERKSEYGMSNTSFDKNSPGHNNSMERTTVSQPERRTQASGIKNSLSPQLPDVARMSGFGELFISPSERLGDPSAASTVKPNEQPHPAFDQDRSGSPLQHQPSLGFRSVVNQAFDTTQEPIPETPSSSAADSSIGRSGSGGTSAVSPIISRGPSSATTNLNFRDPHVRPATPPSVCGVTDNTERPISSGSLSTPKAIPRRPSPDLADHRPARFMPGHRRDLSTPSPDNSPARTPALEANKQLQQPQEAELAMTTPIETHFPSTYGQQENFSSGQTSPSKSTSAADLTRPNQSVLEETPQSPAESTRSRVRNLADRFESGRSSPATSERAPSPVKASFVHGQMNNQPRPLAADRLESFRPKLPGGWESSASLAPSAVLSKPEVTSKPIPLEQRLQDSIPHRSNATAPPPNTDGSQREAQGQKSAAPSQIQEAAATSDPFASLAAAGSALAGAFSSVIGSDSNEADRNPSADASVGKARQPDPSFTTDKSTRTLPRKTSMNTDFIPEASKPLMPATPDDGTSSIMPTPLDKLSQPAVSEDDKSSDYFAAGARPLSQQAHQTSVDSYTTQDSASTKRSQLLPSLSTDTIPQYESDRIRREIMRELSPRLTSEPSTAESVSPMRENPRSAENHSLKQQHHESLIIPREYDRYWNGSSSEQSSRASSVKGPPTAVREAPQANDHGQSNESPVHGMTTATAIISGEGQGSRDDLSVRPDMPAPRFSWETPSDKVPAKQSPLQNVPKLPVRQMTDYDESPDMLEDQSLMRPESSTGQQGPDTSTLEQGPVGPSAPVGLRSNDHANEPRSDGGALEIQGTMLPSGMEPNAAASEPLANRDQLAPTMTDFQPSITDSGLHLDEEIHESEEEVSSPLKTLSTANTLPSPALPGTPPKIQSFRKILALKDPKERIRGYNETREEFANMNTGLARWLAVTTSEMPEHEDILPNGRLLGVAGAKPLASRTKLGGFLPSGSSSLQQSHANTPSGAQTTGGNSMQGFSPSSGSVKLSSQQMQARGKDLLHTAGVFGGKANVAAKGLFSKGRSKFRGGNNDKAPISSFNTKQDQGVTPTQQSFQDSPNTPTNDGVLDQSHASEQSFSSRPRSETPPSEHQTPKGPSPTTQGSHQPPSLPVEHPEGSGMPLYNPSTTTARMELPESLGSPPPIANQDVVHDLSSTETAAMGTSKDSNVIRTQSVHETLLDDQNQDTQSSGPNLSSNRTPTQADYADYFRRGSSPTAKFPTALVEGMNEEPLAATQRPLAEQRERGLDFPPTLQSKYSTKNPTEVLPADVKLVRSDRDRSLSEQDDLQRGSEDSGGTFHTAGSVVGTDNRKPSIGLQRDIASAGDEQSAEPSVSRISSSESSTTPPVAVPAANIQDQPKARPFSFIQFSQNSTPKPLEDYSQRRPSIDSLPSQIDPEQDVPPSPISPQRSVIYEQDDQPGSRGPMHHSVDHDFRSDNARTISGSPSRSFSRPFSDSNMQDLPAFRRGNSPKRETDLPAEHYPAPVPRQDAVNPRQQATEYSLEGIGPPPPPQPVSRPTQSRSSSKRGSRSSAFFRSFRSPTDPISPPPPSEREERFDTDSQGSPRIRKSKSRRSSLFRSLTGAKSNRSEDIPHSQQDSTLSTRAKPSDEFSQGQRQPVQSTNIEERLQAATDNIEKTDSPIQSPIKSPGKYRNRLSRSAASKEPEQQAQEPVKKKRFSALGSLFGRSKEQKGGNNALVGRPQHSQVRVIPEDHQQPRDRSSRLSSLTKSGRGTSQSSAIKSGRDAPYDYTRDSLAKEGLLPQKPRQSTSKSPEPSAYHENSAQQQQNFPPRHQSLSQGAHRQDPRPSRVPRQSSLTSSSGQSQPLQTPNQRHFVHSTTTTRTGNPQSGGLRQIIPEPGQLPSFTTTTTTTTRGGKTSTYTRQESLGNNFPRSNSPPPPPPPPKDSWLQSKPHQRSTSSISVVRNSNDRPSQKPSTNHLQRPVQSTPISSPSPPQNAHENRFYSPAQLRSTTNAPLPHSNHSRSPSIPNHQSLPPLQTNISHASTPAGPRAYNGVSPDPEARKMRRSQIESSGTPRAESATIGPGGGTTFADQEARKLRRSQIESMGSPTAGSAGTGSATSDPEARRLRRSQIEGGGMAGREQPNSANAPEIAAGVGKAAVAGETSQGRKSEDEPIVMTATSFPGQEWQPSYGYGGWEDY